jgi:hypothetical protein
MLIVGHVEWCRPKKGPIERTQFKVVGATCEVQKNNFGVYGGNHITTLEEENVHHESKVAMTLESRQCFQMHLVKNIL